ncbi:MAG: hypothetical protein WBL20_08785 [Sphingobium sp.]|uniref:hypothetical protein n=1 Tax=Sphingobium sp. TaxID=1912891 RepID=UPI003BB0FBBC
MAVTADSIESDEKSWGDEDSLCLLTTVERHAGQDARAQVHLIYGGLRVCIPKNIAEGHKLSCAIGWEAAKAVAFELGGHVAHVPRLETGRAHMVRTVVRWGVLAGLFSIEISDLASVSSRHVRHVAAELRRTRLLPKIDASRLPGKGIVPNRTEQRAKAQKRRMAGRQKLTIQSVVIWAHLAQLPVQTIALLADLSARHVTELQRRVRAQGAIPKIHQIRREADRKRDVIKWGLLADISLDAIKGLIGAAGKARVYNERAKLEQSGILPRSQRRSSFAELILWVAFGNLSIDAFARFTGTLQRSIRQQLNEILKEDKVSIEQARIIRRWLRGVSYGA